MKVTAVFHVKGRGMIATLTDLPKADFPLGALLHQGARSWKIVGVELTGSGLAFQRREVSVILRGEGDPDIGPIDF